MFRHTLRFAFIDKPLILCGGNRSSLARQLHFFRRLPWR